MSHANDTRLDIESCLETARLRALARMFESPHIGAQMLLQARDVSLHWYSIFGLLSCVVGLVSLAANSGILLLYRRVYTTRAKRIKHLPVVWLTASNLGMCCTNLPSVVWSCFNSGWPFGVDMCRWHAFLGGLSAFTQIGTLCVITAQRCHAVTTSQRNGTSLANQITAISAVMLTSTLLAGMPFLGVGGFVLDGIALSCTFNYVERSARNVAHLSLMMAIGFLGPLIWIIFCFMRIVRVAKQLPLQGPAAPKQVSRGRKAALKRQEVALARSAAKCISCFLIAWTPYAIICTFSLATERHVHPVLPSMAAVLAKCSTALSVLLYVADVPAFRAELGRTIDPQGERYRHTNDRHTNTSGKPSGNERHLADS